MENSISDGALYSVPLLATRAEPTLDGDAAPLLKDYWTAVSQVFRERGTKPPRRSRLTHGLGIVSLGYPDGRDRRLLRWRCSPTSSTSSSTSSWWRRCAWTGGYWQLGPYRRNWNDLQNTPRDVQVIADHLLTAYRARASTRRTSISRREAAAG